MMLKGLLNSTGLAPGPKPQVKSNANGQAVPLRQAAKQPHFIRPAQGSYPGPPQGNKTSATTASTFSESNRQQPVKVHDRLRSEQPKASGVTSGSQATDIKVEQALLDLNDLKTEAMNQPLPASTQHSQAMAKTDASAFQNPAQREASMSNTASSIFQKNVNSSLGFGKPPQVPTNNVYAATPARDMGMTGTQGSFFSQNGNRSGEGLDMLTPEQLKERLIVAETIMKKLYNRNKELEEYHVANYKVNSSSKQRTQLLSSGEDSQENEQELDGNASPSRDCYIHDQQVQDPKAFDEFEKMLADFKKRESNFDRELQAKESEIRKLQQINLVNSKDMNKTSSEAWPVVDKQQSDDLQRDTGEENMTETSALKKDKEKVKDNKYVQFVETRMQECLEENKRYHMKYCDLRDFSYTQIETLVRQLNSKKKSSVQNSNLNVYKQLFEKERKQWL